MPDKKRLSRKFINGLNEIPIEELHELISNIEVANTSFNTSCNVCAVTKKALNELIDAEMTRQGWS